MIPAPAIEVQPFEPAALNWFEPTETFYRTRATRLTSVIESLETLERGAVLPRRVVRPLRAGLPSVSTRARAALKEHLKSFLPRGESSV